MTTPRLREHLAWIEAGEPDADEHTLLDPRAGNELTFSSAQRTVIELCDGTRDTPALLAAASAAGVELDRETLDGFVAMLGELELVARADAAAERTRTTELRAERRAELDRERDRLLADALRWAWDVPLFRGLWASCPGDLAGLPTIDKQHLRASFPDALLPPGRAADRLYTRRTSGTSSDGVQSFREPDEDLAQDAALMKFAPFRQSGIGLRMTTRQCTGGACPLDPPRPGEHRHRVADGILFLDLREDLLAQTDDELEAIAAAVERERPTYVATDAAYLAAFLRYLARTGHALPRLTHVQTGFAFTCTSHRTRIAAACDGRVFDLYSSSELGIIAGECPAGRMHVVEPVVIAEVLDDDGRAVGAGELGELVVTTASRTIAPLVRYRTGDLVRPHATPCPCGAAEMSLRFEGRARDTLRDRDGRVRTTYEIDRAIGADPALHHYQLQELASGGYELRVIGDAGGADERLAALLDAPVRVKRVSRIAAEPSGKFRFTRPPAA